MDDPGARDQMRYLELRLAECRHRPELHVHSIAAYEQNLRVLHAASSLGAYLVHTRDMFEVCRAEWLDRHYNEVGIQAALGGTGKTRASAMNYQAGLAATSNDDFVAVITAAHSSAAAACNADHIAQSAIARIAVGVLDWHTQPDPVVRDLERSNVRQHWQTLREADPACDWQRLRTHAPYRDRWPLSETALDTFGEWMLSCIPEAGHPAEARHDEIEQLVASAQQSAREYAQRLSSEVGHIVASDSIAPVRPASEAAAGYHAMRAGIPAADPSRARIRAVYDRIIELERASTTSTDFARRMAENGTYLELARASVLDDAYIAVARCAGKSELHLDHHYSALIAALDRCHSPLEVHFETTRAAACFDVEIAWNQIFLTIATKALRAVAEYEQGPTPMLRERVERSARAVRDLIGTSWEQTLEIRRVAHFFDHMVFTSGQQVVVPDGVGVRAGEVGSSLVLVFQEAARASVRETVAAAITASDQLPDVAALVARLTSTPRFSTPDEMRAHLTALYRTAVTTTKVEASPAQTGLRQVAYWRTPTHLDDLVQALAAPPRPATVLH